MVTYLIIGGPGVSSWGLSAAWEPLLTEAEASSVCAVRCDSCYPKGWVVLRERNGAERLPLPTDEGVELTLGEGRSTTKYFDGFTKRRHP